MARMRRTETIPEPINSGVATSERTENRDMPQTPWPLVQPLPRRVPNPTNNPPTISSNGEEGYCDITPSLIQLMITAPTNILRTNVVAKIQGGPDLLIADARANRPLIPAIRPAPSSRTAAANPINNPPIKPLRGMACGKLFKITFTFSLC